MRASPEWAIHMAPNTYTLSTLRVDPSLCPNKLKLHISRIAAALYMDFRDLMWQY
jgi:hypothetical protein